MSSRRSGRRATAAAFPALSEGIRKGLQRLITDNADTVAQMLDVADDNELDKLCEKCAQVMKQQQLSASSFLARFFDADLLAAQAKLYQKSTKGTAATLADRIATAWANNVKPVEEEKGKEKEVEDDKADGNEKISKRKRDKEAAAKEKEVDDDNEAEEKEESKKKSKKKDKVKK